MNTDRRVVVTGMGIVAPNGHGLDEFEQALRQGRSGIRFIQALKDLNFSCQVGGIPQTLESEKHKYFSQDELIAMNESMTYACVAGIDAFRDAGLKIVARNKDEVYEDTGAIIGTGIGGLDTFSYKVLPMVSEGKVRRLGSTIVEQVMASAVSARLGAFLALGNQVTTNSSACSTGTEAVIMGAERIRCGLAQRMVVGGAEGSCPSTWAGFDSMRVLSRAFNDHPEKASRPLSASAGGFVPGSGAAVLVIEELETAVARGARIYAEILGTSLTSGGCRFGGSMTAPSPQGVQRAIRQAVLASKIKPGEIDYINGHLTATFADPFELKNWQDALEVAPEDLPFINSTKSLIGHGLGAAGAMECVATLLQLHKGFIHPSINAEDLHEGVLAYEKSIVRKTVDNVSLNITAKASFGFGDVNSCIIFKKWSN